MDQVEEESTPLVNRGRVDSVKSCSSTVSGIQVHIYFLPTTKDATDLHLPIGSISAENICNQAAKMCGILPVYQSLFALASSDLTYWYPPTHVFSSDQNILVHFRVRFCFSNWFGQGPRTSYRYGLTRDRISPVLDYSVIEYLFAQSRKDFVASEVGVSPPLSAQEACLSLALLDLWSMAKEKKQSIRELCKTVSYKSCLPKLHYHDIQKRSRLDRYRIRNTLKKFLKRLGKCSVDEYSLKLKYLLELAAIAPSLGSEMYKVNHCTGYQTKEPAFTNIRISGEAGIQTSRSNELDSNLEWQTFCDFQEIIDINVNRVGQDQAFQDCRVVTVTRNDDRLLEATFQSLREALSFMSLVDGYFRLTTDSYHYFHQDIAPPSLLENIRHHCHGPITSEFAVNKLKKSHSKRGTFVLRQSPLKYNDYFLTVCVQTSLGLDYKDCLITKDEQRYTLLGVNKSFDSLKELTTFYQRNKLLLVGIPVQLAGCCPPQPKEFTNLIIMRNSSSVEPQRSPTPQRKKFSHIQFQMIKYEHLKLDECLGKGCFTRVFRGTKEDMRDGERHVTDVLLKELDVNHKNCWESFFEAASLMSQISHKHFLHVYGVSVHGAQNIMVQEFVKYGALDLYLKRQTSVSVSWKLDVAKQLALALNFLEEKNLTHGNISAKNVLLAREGTSQGTSSFIKLSDPGINMTLLDKEVILDRIPWVAPELLEDSSSLSVDCDKWSFGATLWEIFNNGETPLQGWDLDKKRHFYETYHQLVPSQWTELADLIGQCMDYQQALRPSSRAIIRQLNSLITSDYVLLHAAEAPAQRGGFWRNQVSAKLEEHTVFEERYLCYIDQLGKGNFGCVELCRYDPLGDSTGELLAVKKLQANKEDSLEDFSKEIHTLSVLHCDYIIKYRGVCYSTGRLSMSLVMEYMPHGSLVGYLEKNASCVTIRRMLLFASQICQGMEYLQSVRYVHRDLAARNILVASESTVKIADFGLAKIIPYDKEYYCVTQPGESPIFWHAPESIMESKFSHKSDVWSFGVVLHELFSYCDRHNNPKKFYMEMIGSNMHGASIAMHLLRVLKENGRLKAPLNCPPRVYSVMKHCWAYSSEERPCFTALTDVIENIAQEEKHNLGS